MATFITKQDVNDLLYFAAFTAAQRVSIPDAEWEPVETLSAAVRKISPALGSALDAFTAAYLALFTFSEQIDSDGKSGNLSPDEQALLIKLIRSRDDTRTAFITALKSNQP